MNELFAILWNALHLVFSKGIDFLQLRETRQQ